MTELETAVVEAFLARPQVFDALGTVNFVAGPIAHLFQETGEDIPHKYEAEQAYVLRWLLGLVLRHEDGWKKAADLEIQRRVALRKAAAP